MYVYCILNKVFYILSSCETENAKLHFTEYFKLCEVKQCFLYEMTSMLLDTGRELILLCR